jgi:hypothetical protein
MELVSAMVGGARVRDALIIRRPNRRNLRNGLAVLHVRVEVDA